jgi:hypothetical protein
VEVTADQRHVNAKACIADIAAIAENIGRSVSGNSLWPMAGWLKQFTPPLRGHAALTEVCQVGVQTVVLDDEEAASQ